VYFQLTTVTSTVFVYNIDDAITRYYIGTLYTSVYLSQSYRYNRPRYTFLQLTDAEFRTKVKRIAAAVQDQMTTITPINLYLLVNFQCF